MATPPTLFEDIEHLWITMPDGIRLAARLWLPRGAETDPVPAIFEIIPYRKGDMVRARDERNHPFFASHGYACLRVDMRGSGDSDGMMGDMYEPDELTDTRHVIDWIADQPWCNGRVGMFGTSWGGTASLQACVDAPEALKTVIAVCATHDRYEDDIHHMGGCLIPDSIEWGATLPSILASPPSAETVGPAWREMWHERLDNLTFPLEAWVREEARGEYWRWGSTKFQADKFDRPILAIGGWSDRYSNSVMSLAEARPDMVWGIVGPWGHHYPDVGHPGPGMDFQKVALEWWDRWLKSLEPQDIEWPKLRVWQREFDPPQDALDRRNGSWIECDATAADRAPLEFRLSTGALTRDPPSGAPTNDVQVPFDLRVSQAAGDTGYFGRFGGLPLDQASDDQHSLVYETEPLTEDMIFAGAAEFSVEVETSSPAAQLAVRINDVSPDGKVCRVAIAIRNLALDEMFDEREGAETGRQRITIKFHTTAYRFKAGHRLRLALSSSYWPLVWPSPTQTRLSIAESSAMLSLPVHKSAPQPANPVPPEPPTPPATPNHTTIEAHELRRASEELNDGTLITSWHQPPISILHHATNATFSFEISARHSIHPDDPLSAKSRFDHMMEFERPDGTAKIVSWAAVNCDEKHYHLSGEVTAFWNGEQIFSRAWSPSVKRRCS